MSNQKRSSRSTKKPKSARKEIEQRISEGLKAKSDLFKQRGSMYGRNYIQFGDVMTGIFPKGITLKTREDFIRFGLFVQVMAKTTRYGNAFKKGHRDSLDDISVYSQMMAEVDVELGVGR